MKVGQAVTWEVVGESWPFRKMKCPGGSRRCQLGWLFTVLFWGVTLPLDPLLSVTPEMPESCLERKRGIFILLIRS